MKTDTVIRNEGIRLLIEHLGKVEAERFIALACVLSQAVSTQFLPFCLA